MLFVSILTKMFYNIGDHKKERGPEIEVKNVYSILYSYICNVQGVLRDWA